MGFIHIGAREAVFAQFHGHPCDMPSTVIVVVIVVVVVVVLIGVQWTQASPVFHSLPGGMGTC